MLRSVKFLVANIMVWLLVFNLHRVVFLLVFHKGLSWGPFQFSLPLDLSAAAYLTVLPFLLTVVNLFGKGRWSTGINRLSNTYLLTVLVIVCLIQAGDVAVYHEWQTKLPFKALKHFEHPLEPILTASPIYLLAFLATFVGEFFFGWLLYRRWLKNGMDGWRNNVAMSALIGVPIVAGLLFLAIRGGWGQFPISISKAYYSDEAVLNDAAVNSLWQFGADALDNLSSNNHLYAFMSDNEAKQVVQGLYPQQPKPPTELLKVKRPNIVLLILESWSADCEASLGGLPDITPGFDSLAKQGVLFTNFYANSWMSEKGNAAILSGCPALPTTSIADHSTVYRRMPCINQPLQQQGYQTAYYYGGYLYFANIRSYLLDHGFETVRDRSDFKDAMPMGQLGVHDGVMLPYFLQQLNQMKPPFFSVMFTLSTHSPYDIPKEYQTGKDGEQQPYVDAMHYADASISAFIKSAQQQPWYDSTLFVLVADHSHPSPIYHQPWSKGRFTIPMLFFGPALKDSVKGMRVDKLASQIDIAATVLGQLGITDTAFRWSNDILSPSHPDFVPYAFHQTCGWIEPSINVAWSVDTRTRYDQPATESAQALKHAQGYFQQVWNWLDGK